MPVSIAANPTGWNDFEQSLFDECEAEKYTKNCLSFNTDSLCTHYHADHNYYALCRNLLSKYADDTVANRMDGLLHNMPDFAKVCIFSHNRTYNFLSPDRQGSGTFAYKGS